MDIIEGILYLIWRGLAIGVIISAPMGPVGILCIQRTLEKGRKTGFFTGIGAALSDLFYCLLTGFGLSFIEEFLKRNQNMIQLIGSVVLIAFGIYLFRSNPSRKLRKPEENEVSAKKNILNGFLFTFSNPLIIFLIIGLFARFNFMSPDLRFYHYIIGFASIFAGALLWWHIVTYFVEKVRAHFNLRSMWLINKIIGGIILIFALVGIISATTSLVSATPHAPVYMNASRGYSDFTHATPEGIVIADTASSRLTDMIPAGSSHLIFEFRARNHNNSPRRKYRHRDADGRSASTSHPAWGIRLASVSGDEMLIKIKTFDDITDETYNSPRIRFEAILGDSVTAAAETDSGMDLFTGINAYRLKCDGDKISFYAGNRQYKPMLSVLSGPERIDSIGFFVMPGARLEARDISLEYTSPGFSEGITHFGNPDVLETILLRSRDPMEGIWRIFDRSLDEDLLRMGGDYRLALVNDGDAYLLIYLDGARTEPQRWKPGMVKARLISSGFTDIYNVEWFDATGHILSNEIKAQYSAPLITLTFPYHSSTLRLRKESSPRHPYSERF